MMVPRLVLWSDFFYILMAVHVYCCHLVFLSDRVENLMRHPLAFYVH